MALRCANVRIMNTENNTIYYCMGGEKKLKIYKLANNLFRKLCTYSKYNSNKKMSEVANIYINIF